MSAVLTAISTVMGKVGSVTKDGTNSFHNYKFAAASDVIHKVQPLMASEGLVILQSEMERAFVANGDALSITYNFALLHKNGETWPPKDNFNIASGVRQTGMAASRNSKGGFDDKCANKCHTAARKYFLLALFQIPTGDYDDADAQEDRRETPAAPIIKPMPPAPEQIEIADKETGEIVSPQLIADPNQEEGGPRTWIEWGSRYIAYVESSSTIPEFVKWEIINAKPLMALKTAAPAVYKKLRTRIDKHKEAVTDKFLTALGIAIVECTTKDGINSVWELHNESMAGMSKEGHDKAAELYEAQVKKIGG